ncbi:alpha/beta hydrolase [Thiolinea disciformis]|uniref:alpha/beta hydrolase n=1 Tax=Thiolinea disciformis TaxID=125614 RepID=UPI00037911E8|nr:alpha/beta hydrolase [Thiolinea disciformis]
MSTIFLQEKNTLLLEPDLQAFIQQVDAHYPVGAETQAIEAQRALYNQILASFAVPISQDISVKDGQFISKQHTINTRIYQHQKVSARAQIIYFHGGGFVLGGLDSHHGICADLCAGTGLKISSIDYRLAPEYLYPAALEDAVFAYTQLATQSDLPLIVMGDSAGACLAAHVAQATKQSPKPPLAQVLIYPVLGSDLSLDSYQRYAEAPLLTTTSMLTYWQLWLGQTELPQALAGIPLAEQDFTGLAPALVFSAEYDPLVDEAQLYCEKIQEVGGQATWVLEAGLVHGYLHARHQVKAAQASFARIQQALSDLVA